MITRKMILPLLLTLGITGSMLAQTSAPNPANRVQRRVNFLTTLLTLTPSQQQQATSIFTNAVTTNAGVVANLKATRQTLWTAIQNDDTAGITAATNTIGTLVAQLSANHAQATAAFYKILTPDQQAKFTQFHGLKRKRLAI